MPFLIPFLLQRLYHIDEYLTLKLADELELENGEDAPMSMAAHPTVRHLGISRHPQTYNHVLRTGVLVCMWYQQHRRRGQERR